MTSILKVQETYRALPSGSMLGGEFEKPAVPARLQFKNPLVDKETVRLAMEQVFLVSSEVERVVGEILARGEAHATHFYASGRAVVEAIYNRDSPWGGGTTPATMLSGLAGTGKTQTLKLVNLICARRAGSYDLPAHPNLTHTPAWWLSFREASTLPGLLGPHLWPQSGHGDETPARHCRADELLPLARRSSRRNGTCLILADEFQYLSHGTAAAAVTKMLLKLQSVGPAMVFGANFSLGYRLQNRNQEDRHRFVTQNIVLRPESAGSACYARLVGEYFKVAPDQFSMTPSQVLEQLHRYTYGIKRATVDLLALSWAIAVERHGRKGKVTPAHLEAAYKSHGFMTYRAEVEALWRINGGDLNQRKDLICPFETVETPSNVVKAGAAIAEYRSQIAHAHLEASMTNAERAEVERQRAAKKQAKSKDNVRSLSRTTPTTSSMLDAYNDL